ncbi:MipA/OmpV family protein [Sphingobium sp. BYY-5]|uniref:MipA/OmpV family protein n=1 Tax=Sphingobium sp. BYY-5 TaxID=2926400 RepID=UPI001FA6B582|nr:MipA/OmpV family protein [Sphingobium sp. BYY-5]MCI4592178.1 MipA/OmpV family protein [Sphingobium sp. BYY-5]
MRFLISIPLVCIAAVAATTAQAQQAALDDGAPHGMVAIGVGVVPEFDGSGDVRPFPFATADIRWGGVNFQIRGAGARVDLVSDPRFAIGPVIGPRLPRRDADGRVGLLPEIGTAIEAGGFVGYRLGGNQLGQGAVQLELSLVHDISNTHNGLLATGSASYSAIQNRDMFVSFDLQTTWANADYSRTYFGIDQAGAAASGLAAYAPGSGLRDVGGGVTAGYWFSKQFGVIARAGATYLVGNVANSPIVEEGSRWQPAAGLMLSYRF